METEGGSTTEKEREKHIHRPRLHSGVNKSQGLTSISKRGVQNKHQGVPNGAGRDGLQEQVLEEGLDPKEAQVQRQAPPGYPGHVFEGGAKWFGFGSWSEHFPSSLEVGSFFSQLLQDPGIRGLGVWR